MHPKGELALATIVPMREEWKRIVEEQQPAHIVIDLSLVTFLDDSALVAIVHAYKRQATATRTAP